MLELPSGGVEPADHDPVAAAQRELAEETGHGGGQWRLVATLWPNPGNQSNRLHVVLATGVGPTTMPNREPGEELEIVHLSVPDAAALALAGDLPQAMHVAALTIALAQLDRLSPRPSEGT